MCKKFKFLPTVRSRNYISLFVHIRVTSNILSIIVAPNEIFIPYSSILFDADQRIAFLLYFQIQKEDE